MSAKRQSYSVSQKQALRARKREDSSLTQQELAVWFEGQFDIPIKQSTVSDILSNRWLSLDSASTLEPDRKKLRKHANPLGPRMLYQPPAIAQRPQDATPTRQMPTPGPSSPDSTQPDLQLHDWLAARLVSQSSPYQHTAPTSDVLSKEDQDRITIYAFFHQNPSLVGKIFFEGCDTLEGLIEELVNGPFYGMIKDVSMVRAVWLKIGVDGNDPGVCIRRAKADQYRNFLREVQRELLQVAGSPLKISAQIQMQIPGGT